MTWSDLSRNQRVLAIAGAIVVLALIVGGAYAIGRSGRSSDAGNTETTATAEVTAAAEPEPVEVAAEPEPETPAPEVEPETAGEAPDAGPSDEAEVRLFGQLKGIRDESGGSWGELYADVDTAAFLTGQEALDWLTARGDAEFYNANYWYARNDDHSVGAYRILASAQPVVWMYTWPTTPAPGFYGPGMDKQVVTFGEFYDRIYMYEDEEHLLNRYYWFTIEDGHVTIIEEQPRDSYYEP
jgi:hypothetical protein